MITNLSEMVKAPELELLEVVPTPMDCTHLQIHPPLDAAINFARPACKASISVAQGFSKNDRQYLKALGFRVTPGAAMYMPKKEATIATMGDVSVLADIKRAFFWSRNVYQRPAISHLLSRHTTPVS